MDKPHYKEKIRVRAYGDVNDNGHRAFVELKKKVGGKVYKRRCPMTLTEAAMFTEAGIPPDTRSYDARQMQIMNELAWTIGTYKPLRPLMMLRYRRTSYSYAHDSLHDDIRITIDQRLSYARGSWQAFFSRDDSGQNAFTALLSPDKCLLEIKSLGGLPLELTHALCDIGIFPVSYSKVGKAYEHDKYATAKATVLAADSAIADAALNAALEATRRKAA
jgi:hypothetical protein